jgi:hypothetical protein
MVTEGIDHFFSYSPQLGSTIVDSLLLVGCKRIAAITQRALRTLRLASSGAKQISAAMATLDERREEELSRCSTSYWKAPGPARRLLAFIKANKQSIRF